MQRGPGAFSMPETYTTARVGIDYDEQFMGPRRGPGTVFHAVMMADSADYPSFAQSQIQPRTTMGGHDSLHPSSAILFQPAVRRKVYETRHVIDGIFPGLARASRTSGASTSCRLRRRHPGGAGNVWFGANPPVYLPSAYGWPRRCLEHPTAKLPTSRAGTLT